MLSFVNTIPVCNRNILTHWQIHLRKHWMELLSLCIVTCWIFYSPLFLLVSQSYFCLSLHISFFKSTGKLKSHRQQLKSGLSPVLHHILYARSSTVKWMPLKHGEYSNYVARSFLWFFFVLFVWTPGCRRYALQVSRYF